MHQLEMAPTGQLVYSISQIVLANAIRLVIIEM